MEQTQTTTELVSVKELMKSFKNPRKIDERALEELKSQIMSDPLFLLKRPILVNRVNKRLIVYAGNQRLSACIALGIDKVPVRIEENIDKDLLDRRMLLDNVSRGEFIEESLVKNFADQLQMIQNSDMFKDMDFRLDTKKEKVSNKLIYLKLTFQLRDDLNLFYQLLDELASRYPDDSVSQRLLTYLNSLEEEES